MKGSVIINNVDIADLGMFIPRGGDYDFLPFPERLAPAQTNWQEYSGLDVDLSEVYFKERSLSIGFYLSANNSTVYEFKLNEFYKLVTAGYANLYTREFARTFRLRYLSVADYKHKGGMYKQGNKRGSFKVNFSMDAPLQLFTNPNIIVPFSGKNYPLSGIMLNGIDLAKFGIVVNECYSSMLALPIIKAPLTRRFAKRTGLLAYPSNSPTFEAQEISIRGTMSADTREEFYYNYEVLFNHVSRTGELAIDSHLGQDQCYYTKMDNFRKHGIFAHGVKVSFTLKFINISK